MRSQPHQTNGKLKGFHETFNAELDLLVYQNPGRS